MIPCCIQNHHSSGLAILRFFAAPNVLRRNHDSTRSDTIAPLKEYRTVDGREYDEMETKGRGYTHETCRSASTRSRPLFRNRKGYTPSKKEKRKTKLAKRHRTYSASMLRYYRHA